MERSLSLSTPHHHLHHHHHQNELLFFDTGLIAILRAQLMLGCRGNRRWKGSEYPDCSAALLRLPSKQLAGACESIQAGTHVHFLRTTGSLQSSSGHFLFSHSLFFFFFSSGDARR